MSTPPLFPVFFVVWVYPDSEVKEKWMGWFTRLCTWTASDIFHSFQSSFKAFIIFLLPAPPSLTCTYIALSDRVIISIKGVCLFTSSKWCQTKNVAFSSALCSSAATQRLLMAASLLLPELYPFLNFMFFLTPLFLPEIRMHVLLSYCLYSHSAHLI